MNNRFRYKPVENEPLSVAVVSAIADAHQEGVLEQKWIISDDINTDALDNLFQEGHPNMILRFEADTSTVTIDADDQGDPIIEIESHR